MYPKSQIDFDLVFSTIHFDDHTIVLGDFNSKSLLWNKNGSNFNGLKLQSTVTKYELIIHNKHKTTLINNFGEKSTVDLIITKINSTLKIKNIKIGENIGSDHLPVMFNCYLGSTPQIINTKFFVYKQLNKKKFNNELCEMFKYFYLFSKICKDINMLYKMFVNIYTTATKNHCPLKSVTYKNSKNGNIWWNDEIKKAIKLRNKLRKKLYKHKCSLNVEKLKKQQILVKKLIKDAKKTYWDKINKEKSTDQIYKTLKSLQFKNNSFKCIKQKNKYLTKKSEITSAINNNLTQIPIELSKKIKISKEKRIIMRKILLKDVKTNKIIKKIAINL